MTAAGGARRVQRALVLGGVGAAGLSLVGAPWPLPVDAGLVAHVTGMSAGYLSAVMVALMSRAPVLERHVGSDVLARWHGKGGRLFLILVFAHAGAALAAWAQTRQEDVVTALLAVLGLPGLVQAAVGTILFVVVAGISIGMARRKVSHETWHAIHLLTYVALSLSFLHELAGPNLAGHPVVQVLWSLLHVYALTLVVRFRVLRPAEHAWRHRLKVVDVVPEAPGVVSVILKGRHLTELDPQPGQFFRWRFMTQGLWHTAHPFSLSAPPRGDFLRITVKALGDGSSRIQSMRPGVRVFAEGPSGTLTAARRTQPAVLLIAGGVGITPMRALFESVDARGGLTLIYRASRPEELIFRAELEHLSSRRGAHIIWLTGPSADPRLQLSGPNLLRLVPDLTQRDVYLCASPRLSASIRAGLRAAEVPARQVHEEAFAF